MTRIVAEDLKQISVYKLKEWGLLSLGDISAYSGSINWSRHGEVYSMIGYRLDYLNSIPTLFSLDYKSVDTEKSYSPKITLVSTVNNYGGKRYWFLCPRCSKRCAKLFIYDFQPYCRLALTLPMNAIISLVPSEL